MFGRIPLGRGSLGTVLGLLVVAGTLFVAAPSARAAVCTTNVDVTTCEFGYTGAAQTWVVPAGVSSATFDVQGAQGGSLTLTSGCGAAALGGLGGGEDVPLAVELR